ncbi:hypothetical protein SBRY_70255 [Actinacidiphila bryophytorum]|uniref:Uncharacterized protein n=1 Tax=Actinacidiphila bryophytorum TaxID=1436133 RepID=A0A9W4H7C4_9ACTN|nr:hypothetical protein SBRY_70255 [Actinacidiphila bryophytorum]
MPGAQRSHAVLRQHLLRHHQLRGPGHRARRAVRLPPRGAVPARLPRGAQPRRRLVLPGRLHGARLHARHRERHGALRRLHRRLGQRAQRLRHHRPARHPAGRSRHAHRVRRHRHLGHPHLAGRHTRHPAAGPLPGLRRLHAGRHDDHDESDRHRADGRNGVHLHGEGRRHRGEPLRGVPRGHRDHHRYDDTAADRCVLHRRLQGDQLLVGRLPGGRPGHQHRVHRPQRLDADLHLRRRPEDRQRLERHVRPVRAEGHGDQPLLLALPPPVRHDRPGLHGHVLGEQRGAHGLRVERHDLHIAPPGSLGDCPSRWGGRPSPGGGLVAQFRPQSFAWGHPQRLLGGCHLL